MSDKDRRRQDDFVPAAIGVVVGGLAGRLVGGALFGRAGAAVGMIAGAYTGMKKAQQMAREQDRPNPWRSAET